MTAQIKNAEIRPQRTIEGEEGPETTERSVSVSYQRYDDASGDEIGQPHRFVIPLGPSYDPAKEYPITKMGDTKRADEILAEAGVVPDSE